MSKSKGKVNIVGLSGKSLNKKPSITIARLIAREPKWENQIKFQHTFFELNAKGYELYPEDLDCLVWWGDTVASSRNKAAKLALSRQSDYLMFIDDDMTCNNMADEIIKLIEMDVDIASSVAVTRGQPYWPNIAKVYKLGDSLTSCDSYIRKILDWPNGKPFEVDIVGTAFMLIKKEVLEKMVAPWFYMPPSYTEENIIGEDTVFCFNAKMHGFKIWIDPTIDMRHIGNWGYGVSENSPCYLNFKEVLLSDAKTQFKETKKWNIENNDSTHNLVPEVQEVFAKGEGPKRMFV